MIYVPYSQMNEPADEVGFGIRADGDPEALINAARRAVQAVAPTALATPSATLAQRVDEILVLERLLATLGSAIGLLCLVLTAIGALSHGNLRVSLPPGCPDRDLDELAAAVTELVHLQRAEAGVL
jgi:hypothetical protein